VLVEGDIVFVHGEASDTEAYTKTLASTVGELLETTLETEGLEETPAAEQSE
jgi:ATP-dependent helicase/DNAse subunit B